MIYRQIAFYFLLATLACAQLKNRTSPTGYSDTPVLPGQKWKVHDIDRPRPALVTPGAQPGMPPSDAIILFDGKGFSHWLEEGGKMKLKDAPPTWKLEN